MAKDPAVLWYWNDWNGGTVTFTRHLKGCYIDLLSAQFNNGRLSLADIKTVLGADFGPAWPSLQKKFVVDESGLYYNSRMEVEKEKRKVNSDKQTERIKKRWSGIKSGNTAVLPKIEDVNENGIGNRNSSFGKSENLLFTIEHCAELSMNDQRWIDANKTNRDELEAFNKFLEQLGTYEKNPADYKQHFGNLKRKYPDRVKPLAKVLSIEELRAIAKDLDEQTKNKKHG